MYIYTIYTYIYVCMYIVYMSYKPQTHEFKMQCMIKCISIYWF